MEYKDINLEVIEESLKEYEKNFPSIVHEQWEENGERFSSWKINTGTNIIRTGDGGMKAIEEAFKKEAEKYLNATLAPNIKRYTKQRKSKYHN